MPRFWRSPVKFEDQSGGTIWMHMRGICKAYAGEHGTTVRFRGHGATISAGRRAFFPRASERRVLPIVGVCKTSSHLHIFSSSHPLIFTSSHLHIFSSSYLLIFTSSHLHILSSSHLLIFTSSHLHILSSSHPLIFTSSHLHIFSSSHLLIFTSSHLHIFFTSSHIFSHLLTSSHIFSHLLTSSHIFSHLLIFTSSHLTPSPLALLPSPSFLFLSWRREQGQWQRDGTKRNPGLRTKWGSIAKNWSKIAISTCPAQPFRTKWGSIAKNWGKIVISTCPAQPFRTKWGSIVKNWSKIAISCFRWTVSHEMRFDRQKLK